MRRSLRHKVIRAIDEVVGRYHQEQAEQLKELRREVAELRTELRTELRNDLHAELGRQTDLALRAVREMEFRSRRDIYAAGERKAAADSSRFAAEHMPNVPTFTHPHDTLRHALTLIPEEGLALEFGVCEGTTLRIIAAACDGREVYGFDSFEGLPEDWRSGFPAGTFSVDGLPDVPGAELVAGWFEKTLPGFLDEHAGPVAFLHVDCDLYSSTATVLELVGPRLRPGSIVQFDEFFNYPTWQEHECRAWQEYVERVGISFEYAGYTINNEQVIVRITEVP
jgi:hypothetical protein